MKTVPLTQGRIALVSDRDYAYLRQFKWYCSIDRNNPYPQTWNNGEPILMHRMIATRAGFGAAEQVDHRDGNRLNNQRANLRPATKQQNMQNRGATKRSPSGHKGVYWCASSRRWHAAIKVNKKKLFLGSFATLESAVKKRQQAERRYFGTFAHSTARAA